MEKEIKNEWELLEQKLRKNSRKEFSGSIFGTKIKIEAVYDVIFEFMDRNTNIWGKMKKIVKSYWQMWYIELYSIYQQMKA